MLKATVAPKMAMSSHIDFEIMAATIQRTEVYMYCPRCQAEYVPGVTRCGDCGIELVDHLAPQPAAPADSGDAGYVVIATVQGPLEEGQILSFLRANGIPAEVRGEGVRQVYGLTLNGLGAAQVLVPRHLALDARELLERADRGELEIDAEKDGD
jgi:hypothetical protein